MTRQANLFIKASEALEKEIDKQTELCLQARPFLIKGEEIEVIDESIEDVEKKIAVMYGTLRNSIKKLSLCEDHFLGILGESEEREPNQRSKDFIEWSMKLLENDTFFKNLVEEMGKQFRLYYLEQDRAKVLQTIRQKLEKGALVYETPDQSIEKAQAELEEEFIDVLGWALVKKWNYERSSL